MHFHFVYCRMEKFYQMVLLLFPLMDFVPLYIENVTTLLVFVFCCFLLFPFFQVVQLFLFFLLFLSRGVRHHFYLKQLLKTFFIRWMNAVLTFLSWGSFFTHLRLFFLWQRLCGQVRGKWLLQPEVITWISQKLWHWVFACITMTLMGFFHCDVYFLQIGKN